MLFEKWLLKNYKTRFFLKKNTKNKQRNKKSCSVLLDWKWLSSVHFEVVIKLLPIKSFYKENTFQLTIYFLTSIGLSQTGVFFSFMPRFKKPRLSTRWKFTEKIAKNQFKMMKICTKCTYWSAGNSKIQWEKYNTFRLSLSHQHQNPIPNNVIREQQNKWFLNTPKKRGNYSWSKQVTSIDQREFLPN